MELTFITDLGDSFSVEIDPNMELENVMALLEAESGIPISEQSIFHNDREISQPKATMRQLGVVADRSTLILRRKVTNQIGGGPVAQDPEMMRLQLLGNPELMRQLREVQPELAEAAQSDPARFPELLRHTRETQEQYDTELQHQRAITALNADPFDVEAQRKIEELIRQQAVQENMAHALEYSPESFGRVTMLYIPVEVNGVKVKAFVDSGAQQTIMSPECAERCGIMRLLDMRFAGIARGVGTAKILGRIHSAQLKLADIHLPCSVTVMEGRDVELLFGLDMLKAHQACIDLQNNVLRIQGREVRFLAEHELPKEAFASDAETSSPQTTGSATQSGSRFTGGGNTLGSAPGGSAPSGQRLGASGFPESDIQTLMDLGVTRDVAISTLEATGGQIEVAASLVFGG